MGEESYGILTPRRNFSLTAAFSLSAAARSGNGLGKPNWCWWRAMVLLVEVTVGWTQTLLFV